MKTKEEILKMNKEELINYKWDDDLDKSKENSNCYNSSDCSNCSNCFNCFNCYDCYNCFNCYDCYMCRNLKDKKFCICNVQLTEEEYKDKLKELKEQRK
jgi:hypothetical protein